MKRICLLCIVFLTLPVFPAAETTIFAGDLIKASGPEVYYFAVDSRRYVFPNEHTFFTWYNDFSSVKIISDSELAMIQIGGNVTYRPGTRLLKLTTDPRVYAVDSYRTLRWIQSVAVARSLYGANWQWYVDDLPDAFFSNYAIGDSIDSVSTYTPSSVSSANRSIQSTLGGAAGSHPFAPTPTATPTPIPTPVANQAGAFRWGSYMDTALNPSSFFNSDHTITLWYLSQYEHSYEGPLLANTGSGDFFVEQGNDIEGGDRVSIYVSYGGNTARYEVPDPVTYPHGWSDYKGQSRAPELPVPTWRHLALVRNGDQLTLYLDGVRLCVIGGSGCSDLSLSGSTVPSGTLRMGKRVISGSERETQFYGLIDDVALFQHALSPSEITNLVYAWRLTGREPGLVSRYTFEDGSVPSVQGSAYITSVSNARSDLLDRSKLPEPYHSGTYQLPFESGEVWQVIQGFNSLGSHRGYAAFCWDFMWVAPDAALGQPFAKQKLTRGQPILASAPGTVEEFNFDQELNGEASVLRIQHAPKEFTGYLHMATSTVAVHLGDAVQAGTVVGYAADLGAPGADHLHTCLNDNQPLLATYPLAYSNYYASDDFGKTWAFVVRGMPRIGQWVKR